MNPLLLQNLPVSTEYLLPRPLIVTIAINDLRKHMLNGLSLEIELFLTPRVVALEEWYEKLVSRMKDFTDRLYMSVHCPEII